MVIRHNVNGDSPADWPMAFCHYRCMTFGKRLAHAREVARLTQKRLADLLKQDQSTIAKWETGEREPGLAMIGKLCQTLEVRPDYLFGYGDEPPELGPLTPDEITIVKHYRTMLGPRPFPKPPSSPSRPTPEHLTQAPPVKVAGRKR
jgi:transcriptional regulator with XRE-family HTH domain